jgi:hypothetical protein
MNRRRLRAAESSDPPRRRLETARPASLCVRRRGLYGSAWQESVAANASLAARSAPSETGRSGSPAS